LKRQLKFNHHISRFKQRHINLFFWDWFSVAKDCDLHGLGIALSIRWPSFGGKTFEKKFTLSKWIWKFNYHIQQLRFFLNIFLGFIFLSLKDYNWGGQGLVHKATKFSQKKFINYKLNYKRFGPLKWWSKFTHHISIVKI
jgi:hypothetical protein